MLVPAPAGGGSAAATEDEDYSIRPLTLRFTSGAAERRFIAEHVSRGLSAIRWFLLAACILYASFGILDYYIIPDARIEAWLIRYCGVCPFFLGALLFTYTSAFHRLAQLVLSLCMLVAGLGVIGMTAVAGPPGNAYYYAGLIMVVIYGSSLIRLRCTSAAIISLLLGALYELVAAVINPIPSDQLLSNDFFLGMALGVGIFASYVQELHARHDFISTRLLQEEKTRADYLRAEAEAASKAKSDFLAIVSHELRTPLNAIMGFSEIMRLRMFGPVGSEKYVSYVDDIHNTAQHLLKLITEILDLSKAEVGKLTLREEDVDVVALLDQCFRLLRARAVEQGLRMSLQPPGGPVPPLHADVTLLKQVFLNLLGNALKFTPQGGSIVASVAEEPDGGLVIKVSDTGIGIAEQDLPRVLEPFVQVESAFARKHGGAGLGLPLVQKIVELHGGKVAIESALGAGTTVSVKLPPARSVRRPELASGVA